MVKTGIKVFQGHTNIQTKPLMEAGTLPKNSQEAKLSDGRSESSNHLQGEKSLKCFIQNGNDNHL